MAFNMWKDYFGLSNLVQSGRLRKNPEEEDNVGGKDVTKHSQILDSKQRCFILKFQTMILAWSRFKTPGNKTPKGVRVLKKRRRSARSLTLFFLRNFMANRPQLLQSSLSASAMCFASVTAFFITNYISFRINSLSLFWFFFLLNYNAFLLTTTRFVAASKYFAFFVVFFYNTFQARTIFHSTQSYLWSLFTIWIYYFDCICLFNLHCHNPSLLSTIPTAFSYTRQRIRRTTTCHRFASHIFVSSSSLAFAASISVWRYTRAPVNQNTRRTTLYAVSNIL